jgi:HAD superfamily hydrolase (TIGR01490 family)
MKKGKEVEEEKEVREKSRSVAAFFDLDGTLVALPSLERRFFRMLRYRRALAAKNYWLWLTEVVRLAPHGLSAIWNGNKMYLRGVVVGRPVEGGLKPATSFLEDGIERAAWHAKRGHTIVIVSGTLEPLAQEIARAIETELAVRGIAVSVRVCATRLEQMHGRWTGKILDEAVFGKGKLRAALRMAAEMKLELELCYAYADSSSDRWLLAAVGWPIVVNPSNNLARLARIRAWPVLNWEGRDNLTQRRRGHREIAEKNELPSVTT